MTLWVKLDYKDFYSSDEFKTDNFPDIASVKRWFRDKKETDYSVVKYNGKLMKDTAPVPKTTKDNCLHLLREICIFMYKIYTRKGMSCVKESRTEKGGPTQNIGEILSSKLEIESDKNKILLYKCKVFPFKTELHNFETTEHDRLYVVCTIVVKYIIHDHCVQNVKKIELAGDAKVADFISDVFEVDCTHIMKYISVTYNGEKVSENKNVAECGWDEIFVISYDKINIMKYFTENPTKDKNKEIYKQKNRRQCLDSIIPIYNHREGRVGDDIILYYPAFKQFIDDTNEVVPSKQDFDFAQEMCLKMAEYYKKESFRVENFRRSTEEYFQVCMVQSIVGKSMPDLAIGPCECVQVEIKNEGNNDGTYTQAISYYVQSLKGRDNEVNKKEVAQCPAPAFLLELVGPQLTISGAVYGRYVFVDRLVDPVWLVPQREEAMIRIARIFKALKRAIGEIQQYYQNPNPVRQPRFPIFQSFYKGNIQYKEAIKPHTFKGTLTYYNGTSEKVVVMFVKRYSRETHELMGFRTYAPKLIHYEERVRGTQYTAIIMKYIPNARPLDEFFKYVLKNHSNEDFKEIKKIAHTRCTEALKVMHDHGFCHGKISSKSILGKVQDDDVQIFIVNYKWAGRQGEAKYPLSADIPEGVQPGGLITQEQDLAQLEKLFPDDNESEDADD